MFVILTLRKHCPYRFVAEDNAYLTFTATNLEAAYNAEEPTPEQWLLIAAFLVRIVNQQVPDTAANERKFKKWTEDDSIHQYFTSMDEGFTFVTLKNQETLIHAMVDGGYQHETEFLNNVTEAKARAVLPHYNRTLGSKTNAEGKLVNLYNPVPDSAGYCGYTEEGMTCYSEFVDLVRKNRVLRRNNEVFQHAVGAAIFQLTGTAGYDSAKRAWVRKGQVIPQPVAAAAQGGLGPGRYIRLQVEDIDQEDFDMEENSAETGEGSSTNDDDDEEETESRTV